ncbi:tungstate transport system substrate-binding protein [Ruminiclostridium sufflavum DSM 19573]|uniref:Tungstate transport system substrate-binding protein n=1 Tax=Ruminiclostridium sufflavum DSM 19573 TaxID=1121337 RepID=A0A318XFL1_9FIRM|nr:substrate-binding domain-containing protein [Ruminiclostridium sufflavum]PYG84247.1 tungstate transport system substrate-binding protein [Ruminiclostridium sufflavum DSM 19573]
MLIWSKGKAKALFKIGLSISIISAFMLLFTACVSDRNSGQSADSENSELNLAVTASINNSGLLEYLSPIIKEDTGISIKVISKKAEEAVKACEAGEADMLLINDKALEDKFVSDGYGVGKAELPNNYFVLLGPASDPAGISGQNCTAAEAFKKIADSKAVFISAGEGAITNKKEMKIWSSGNIKPEGDWYISEVNDMKS